jgi:multicomponent Na+:H+ antiporter subunit G
MNTLAIVGAIITLAGAIFLVLGSIGLLRMPDSYTRIQAGTKASTLGSILSLLGLGLVHPDWLGKILLLILFVLVTNPVSSHIIARAAYFINVPLAENTVVDKLKELMSKQIVPKKYKIDKGSVERKESN